MSISPERDDLAQREGSQSIEALQDNAYSTALDSFHAYHPDLSGIDPSVLMAMAELAEQKEKSSRTSQERATLHLSRSLRALSKAIAKGRLTSSEDVELLADSLVYTRLDPSATLGYLKEGGKGNLERALTPIELAGCISLLDDLDDADHPVSISVIAQVADSLGIKLDTGVINEEDIAGISAAIERYISYPEVHSIKDHPKDGPVRDVWRRQARYTAPTVDPRFPNPTNGEEYSPESREDDLEEWLRYDT